MKADKSLEEVWEWKEKVHNETKGMSVEEQVNDIRYFHAPELTLFY
jgi:hypothetical protein